MENKTVNTCYCCKKEKEGTYLDYNEGQRFCCNDCNHINQQNNSYCVCEMPFWDSSKLDKESLKHCAECHKLLPDSRE